MGITSRAIEEHYETEVASYRAEIAQLRAENEALVAEVRRLRAKAWEYYAALRGIMPLAEHGCQYAHESVQAEERARIREAWALIHGAEES